MITQFHQNIALKLAAIFLSDSLAGISEIGMAIQTREVDTITDDGYWLYEYKTGDCYVSDKFLQSLGLERGDVKEDASFFYAVGDKQNLDYGFEMIADLVLNKSESCFVNNVNYTHKDGRNILIQCSGTVFYKHGEPFIILGTHVVLNE